MIKKVFFLSLMIALSSNIIFSEVKWIKYKKSDGLANNYINAIVIDPFGNKWFGTWGGGVSKFDGVKWTNYTTDDGLANNRVNSIAIDSKGNMWFGTGDGVSFLNCNTSSSDKNSNN